MQARGNTYCIVPRFPSGVLGVSLVGHVLPYTIAQNEQVRSRSISQARTAHRGRHAATAHLLGHGPRPGHHRLVLSNSGRGGRRRRWLWWRASVYGHTGDARRLVAAARCGRTWAAREARAWHLHAGTSGPGRRGRARRAARLELQAHPVALRLAGRGRGRTRDKHVGVSQREAIPLEPP